MPQYNMTMKITNYCTSDEPTWNVSGKTESEKTIATVLSFLALLLLLPVVVVRCVHVVVVIVVVVDAIFSFVPKMILR